MNLDLLKNDVLRTLLYYDIFSYPLKSDELFTFLPQNTITPQDFNELLRKFSGEKDIPFAERDGFYYVKPNDHFIRARKEKENVSLKMWRMAGIMTHVIKRFPYVRCILITGSLSKNNSDRSSDLDFMIIAEKNRLWITRTLLMLFKKIFLFNSYKYFCINYYITNDKLEIEEKNIFTATEIAYVKATYNSKLMEDFVKANSWINKYFPNYIPGDPRLHNPGCKVSNRHSYLQKFYEFFFNSSIGDRLNEHCRKVTVKHWNRRYADIEEKERSHMFKSTETVSKAHPLNMQKKVLNRYYDKLKEFNL
jgi:hypothetical protein